MSFIEASQQYIPEYYPNMHRDGFEPWEIQVALLKQGRRIAEEWQQQEIQRLQQAEQIKITSEIKIK